MADILKRLREPPFGTETSERNLMAAAADEIERLREALEKAERLVENRKVPRQNILGPIRAAIGRD